MAGQCCGKGGLEFQRGGGASDKARVYGGRGQGRSEVDRGRDRPASVHLTTPGGQAQEKRKGAGAVRAGVCGGRGNRQPPAKWNRPRHRPQPSSGPMVLIAAAAVLCRGAERSRRLPG
jgi:hypothetical protein